MENVRELTELLIQAVKAKDFGKVREIFDTYPNIDIADALNELDVNDGEEFKYVAYIFKVVKPSYTGEVFSELDNDHKEKLISIFTDKEVSAILEEINNDDIADFIEEMPANLVQKILTNTNNDDRKIINTLLGYKEDSAGSIMTTEYLTLFDNYSVKRALEIIREKGKSAETIYTLFIRNIKWDLIGVLELDDLIFARDEELLKDICETNFQTVNVNTDQETVADLFKRYDLNAIAVLNDDNKLTGIITIDDIIDVIEQETTEDIENLAKVTPLKDSYMETPIFKLAFKCIPWLVVLMVLQVFSIFIQNQFQWLIGSLTAISVFLTTICDAGGNSGSQSSTLMIRGLSTHDFELRDYPKVIWKEIRVALIVGLTVALAAFAYCMFMFAVRIVTIPDNFTPIQNGELPVYVWLSLSGIVSLTLFIAVVMAKFVGSSLPFLFTKMKLDPAVVTSPFVTTIMDVTTLGIYFGSLFLAFKLLGWI